MSQKNGKKSSSQKYHNVTSLKIDVMEKYQADEVSGVTKFFGTMKFRTLTEFKHISVQSKGS